MAGDLDLWLHRAEVGVQNPVRHAAAPLLYEGGSLNENQPFIHENQDRATYRGQVFRCVEVLVDHLPVVPKPPSPRSV